MTQFTKSDPQRRDYYYCKYCDVEFVDPVALYYDWTYCPRCKAIAFNVETLTERTQITVYDIFDELGL